MIHIENISIHIAPPPQHSPIVEAMLKAIFAAPDTAPEPGGEGGGEEIVATTPPRIGEYWRGQGGIYAGVARGENGQPDYHLILAMKEPQQGFTWEDAKAYAQTIAVEGHHDFTLPSRFESALLYANLRDKFNTDHWHWTGTEYSAGRVFNQDFDYGRQDCCSAVSFEARARFVRRFIYPVASTKI